MQDSVRITSGESQGLAPPQTLTPENFPGQDFVALLEWRAAQQPTREAFRFLADGETVSAHWSYAELAERARHIAAHLQAMDAAGERVLLLYPSGLDFIAAFFGCLYAGAVAVPVFPPTHDRTDDRLRAILADADASRVLTTAALRQTLANDPLLPPLHWLSSDDLPPTTLTWQPPTLGGDQLAFLQYTSGSTGDPHGVMVSHGNLLHNMGLIRTALQPGQNACFVSWLPLFHDMGLIGTVLQPLYLGAPAVLMPPLAFLSRPGCWLQAIHHYRATVSGGPNFAYRLTAARVSAAERQSLDLSSWQVAFNGAEPVRADTLHHFATTFRECGFRAAALCPAYGLAEATLLVATSLPGTSTIPLRLHGDALAQHRVVPDPEGEVALVSCGLPTQEVIVVDHDGVPTQDRVGEVWLRSPSVAQGYWQNQEASAATFAAYTQDGDGPYLRSGDLGFLHQGDLYITGRAKDLIIIRGHNHYPQDIEHSVEQAHPAIRPGCVAAFAVDTSEGEQLVIVAEWERRGPWSDTPTNRCRRRLPVMPSYDPPLIEPAVADGIVQAVRRTVSRCHGLTPTSVCLLQAGSIPKTSSGKIQRRACRERFLTNRLRCVAEDCLRQAHTAQDDNDQSRLALITRRLAAILHLDPQSLDADTPLTTLGLDSLGAADLHQQLATDLHLRVNPAVLLQDHTTLRRLAERVPSTTPALPINPRRLNATTFPLASNQRQLLGGDLHHPAYHVVVAARLRPTPDPDILAAALSALVERHPTLRTALTPDHQAQQVVASLPVPFSVAERLPDQERDQAIGDAARQPFELSQAPLWRTRLFPGDDDAVLLLVWHHLITDGWSVWMLLDELRQLYIAQQRRCPLVLPPLAAGYGEFVQWQADQQAWDGDARAAFWRSYLSAPHPPALATDHPRRQPATADGATVGFMLPAALATDLRQLARNKAVTLYTLFLTAFQVLLQQQGGVTATSIASPSSGRNHPDFSHTFGYLAGRLVLRAAFADDSPFDSCLAHNQRQLLVALAHQDYPLGPLSSELAVSPEQPLFQAMFALQKPQVSPATSALLAPGSVSTWGDMQVSGYPLPPLGAWFDLTLEVLDSGDSLGGWFCYRRDLYEPDTMATWQRAWLALLTAVVTDPQISVGRLLGHQ